MIEYTYARINEKEYMKPDDIVNYLIYNTDLDSNDKERPLLCEILCRLEYAARMSKVHSGHYEKFRRDFMENELNRWMQGIELDGGVL